VRTEPQLGINIIRASLIHSLIQELCEIVSMILMQRQCKGCQCSGELDGPEIIFMNKVIISQPHLILLICDLGVLFIQDQGMLRTRAGSRRLGIQNFKFQKTKTSCTPDPPPPPLRAELPVPLNPLASHAPPLQRPPPLTPYRIWSHCPWLKGRNHQLKRTNLRHDLHHTF
jgi:hypothetical protein